jgi:hypothetical protein
MDNKLEDDEPVEKCKQAKQDMQSGMVKKRKKQEQPSTEVNNPRPKQAWTDY